jgi:hypothetical protein
MEGMYILLTFLCNNDMQKYRNAYVRPLLTHKLIKLLRAIINELINVLYTSTFGHKLTALFTPCKTVVVLVRSSLDQGLLSAELLTGLIFDSLSEIVEGMG